MKLNTHALIRFAGLVAVLALVSLNGCKRSVTSDNLSTQGNFSAPVSLNDAREKGVVLKYAPGKVGDKQFYKATMTVEIKTPRGNATGQVDGAMEEEVVSLEGNNFVLKGTVRNLTASGNELFNMVKPELEKEAGRVLRTTFDANGNQLSTNFTEPSTALVRRNYPSRPLKINDSWEGSFVYQLDARPQEKAVTLKLLDVEMREGVVCAVIAYSYNYDFIEDGEKGEAEISERVWLDINTAQEIFKETKTLLRQPKFTMSYNENLRRVSQL